ncbi:hypothetical protein CLAIMM_12416 isoform 2 [Cladophialophora immunda]|nr:hypothetical protein CLAIMM_12416 isoform 2 [Cladophialophora immunda]
MADGTRRILLQDGVVIIHDEQDRAKATRVDVLVKGNRIDSIAANIKAEPGIEIIDCKNKIVAPGFIDTHRHMYSIALRGRHGDNLMEDYLAQGIFQAANFDPTEIYWGQLAGCLECISAGTTTVVDHSHLNYSADHPKAAIAATASSGLRAIYGYCFNARVESWSPFKTEQPFIAPWAMDYLKTLSLRAPFGDGRVQLGVAFDGWFHPKETLSEFFDSIRKLGIKYLTTHNSPPKNGAQSSVQKMDELGLLGPFTVLAHANYLSSEDISLIKKRNAHISTTPSVELQMGIGTPACFDPERDIQSHSSLGIDCHNVVLASIPAEMRMALQSSRGTWNEKFLKRELKPARVYKTVQEAYALGTIAGARAIGMDDQIGSIAQGKLADIIVFDALTPNMICGAQLDPVTAIVMHSTPADVVTTIVDGIVRKKEGQLLPILPDASAEALLPISSAKLGWPEVAEKLLETRATLQAKIDKLDLHEAKLGAMKVFGYDQSKIVASIPS